MFYSVWILPPTFGGMCSWRRVAVARVFALVVRCRVMKLLLYSRVGKNRDTRRGSPAGAGAGRGASHKTASLVAQLSRHGAAIAYTDLLGIVNFLHNPNPLFLQRFCNLPGLMDALKQTQRLLLGLMNQQCRS